MMNAAVFLLALVGFFLVVSRELVGELKNSNAQIASTPVSLVTSAADNKCQCGLFDTETPTETDKPILAEAPMVVTLNETGVLYCKELCSTDSTLAEAVKQNGSQLLCSIVGHCDKLKGSVHSRICGTNVWTYIGLSSPTKICCHDYQVIDCMEHIDSPPANVTKTTLFRF